MREREKMCVGVHTYKRQTVLIKEIVPPFLIMQKYWIKSNSKQFKYKARLKTNKVKSPRLINRQKNKHTLQKTKTARKRKKETEKMRQTETKLKW